MPSTKEKNSFQRARVSDLPGAVGEPSGEPAAPPLRSAQTSRTLSRELVEEAIDLARLRATVSELPEERRAELVAALLEQLTDGREELPDVLNERLLDGMIDRLIAGKRSEREILGTEGVLGELTRRLVERALSEELTEHLGYPPGQAPPGGAGNVAQRVDRQDGADRARPGRGQDAPRDRAGTFEPQLVASARPAWRGWTRRSSTCTPAGCRSATSRATCSASTAPPRSAGTRSAASPTPCSPTCRRGGPGRWSGSTRSSTSTR